MTVLDEYEDDSGCDGAPPTAPPATTTLFETVILLLPPPGAGAPLLLNISPFIFRFSFGFVRFFRVSDGVRPSKFLPPKAEALVAVVSRKEGDSSKRANPPSGCCCCCCC